jgi:hypothetical protein
VVSQNREQLLEVTVSFNNTRSRDAKRRDEVSHSSEVKAGPRPTRPAPPWPPSPAPSTPPTPTRHTGRPTWTDSGTCAQPPATCRSRSSPSAAGQATLHPGHPRAPRDQRPSRRSHPQRRTRGDRNTMSTPRDRTASGLRRKPRLPTKSSVPTVRAPCRSSSSTAWAATPTSPWATSG